jgi:hypothetical protein
MPYVRTDSPSPPRRALSQSPEVGPDVAANAYVKKGPVTAADMQRRLLEKLLENPDKEVQMPTGMVERTVRAPRDMMKNVQGSSAGVCL